jgi:hypothetical protein
MPPKHPELSVVIVMGDPGTRRGLEKTLYSLIHQQSIEKIEILVVDCSPSGAPPLKGSEHPCVRTVKLPRSGTSPPRPDRWRAGAGAVKVDETK